METCPFCDGEGEVFCPNFYEDSQGRCLNRETCNECEGEHWIDCEDCGGTGVIDEEQGED